MTADHPLDPAAPADAPDALAAGLPASTISIRRAHPAELDDAGAVVRRAYEADGHSGDYLDVVADARDRSRDADIIVALGEGNRVLGCVTFVLPGTRWAELSRPGEAEFRMLGVDPGAQGRGVGRALTEGCIDRARALGACRLLLSSLPSMTSAHRLYLRLGFRHRPDLDFSPVPGVQLLGFALDLAGDRPFLVQAPGARP